MGIYVAVMGQFGARLVTVRNQAPRIEDSSCAWVAGFLLKENRWVMTLAVSVHFSVRFGIAL